jgi:hypothetical protein
MSAIQQMQVAMRHVYVAPIVHDPYLGSVQVLLNGESGVVDASGHQTFTAYGTPAVNASIFKYGTKSVYFDGASRLTMPAGATAAYWNWSSAGSYTIESWIYPTSVGGSVYRPLVSLTSSTTTNYWEFGMQANGFLHFDYWTGTRRTVVDTVAITANTWSHVAMSFDGTTIRIFVNGTMRASAAYVGPALAAQMICTIGEAGGGAEGAVMAYYAGYMDDFRLTNGVCRYSGNFTPPTQALPTI